MTGGSDVLTGRVLIVDDRSAIAESLAEELGRRDLRAQTCPPDQVGSFLHGVTHVLLPTVCPGGQEVLRLLLGCEPPVKVVWTGAAPPPAGAAGTWVGPDCTPGDLVALIARGVRPRSAPVLGLAKQRHGGEDADVSREVALVRTLTTRESQVLECLVGGAGGVAIARRLSISPHTVRTHVQNILTKLDVGSRTEAAAVARRAGIRARTNGYEDGIPA